MSSRCPSLYFLPKETIEREKKKKNITFQLRVVQPKQYFHFLFCFERVCVAKDIEQYIDIVKYWNQYF